MYEDNTLDVRVPGVLANDIDPDDDRLTAVLIGTASSGTLEFNTDGTFTYTPNAHFNGTDRFTYRASDGTGHSRTVTATITVHPVPDAPELAPVDDQVVDEGDVLDVSVSASDPDGMAPVLSASNLPFFADLTDHGTLHLAPDFTCSGVYSGIVITATDAEDPSSTVGETIAITVNDVNRAPTDIEFSPTRVDENSPTGTRVGTLTTADPDTEDGHTHTLEDDAERRFRIVGDRVQVAEGAVLDFEADSTHTITVRTTDPGGLIYSKALMIAVNDVNDPPELVLNSGIEVDEGASAPISSAALQVTDEDHAPEELRYTVRIETENGLLTRDGTPLRAGDPFTQEDVDSGLLTYEHDGSETLHDRFTFTVSDGAGGSIGDTSLEITIRPVNDVPDVRIASPAGGDTLSQRAQISLDLSDAENDDLAVSFLVDGERVHTADVTHTLTPQQTIYNWDTFPGYDDGPHRISVTADDGTDTGSDTVDVTIRNAVNVDGQIIVPVHGPVPDRPVADARLELIVDGNVAYSATTDADGMYRLQDVTPNVAGQTYQRRIWKDGKQLGVAGSDRHAQYTPAVDTSNEAVRVKNHSVAAIGPVELHVYDAKGNHTGLLDGAVERGIPHSWYSGAVEPEAVVILNPSAVYEIRVLGRSTETFGLQVSNYITVDGQDIAVPIDLQKVSITADGEIPFIYDYAEIEAKANALVRAGVRAEEAVARVVASMDSDEDGTPDVAETTPIPIPPEVDAGGPYGTDEGGSVIVTASGSDPYGDILTFAWDLDNDGTFETTGQTLVFSATQLDGPSRHIISMEATTSSGISARTQTTVDVRSVAPTATFTNTSGTILEGKSATMTFSDQADPSISDRLAGFLYSCDCTDDSTFEQTGGSAASSRCAYLDDGTFAARGRIADKDGAFTDYTVEVDVNNVAPTAGDITAPVAPVLVNTAVSVSVDFADPGVLDTHTGEWDWGDRSTSPGIVNETGGSGTVHGRHTYTASGTYTVTVTITDDDDGSGTSVFESIVVSDPPVADPGGPYTGNEGSPLPFDGSASYDPDGSIVSHTWDMDCDGVYDDTTGATPSWTWSDDDSSCIALEVTDNLGFTDTDTTTVTILNVAPTAGAITASMNPVRVNTGTTVSADFTDPGRLDTHTAEWDWGDGSRSPGTVNEIGGSGTVSGSHTYTASGLYTVGLSVWDDDGDSGQSPPLQYIIVYDPDGGFISGRGRIASPEGAYSADSLLTGDARFKFVSVYKKGETIPSGETEFRFQAADLMFHSAEYQWLGISGSHATFKGWGTINGSGDYEFVLSARDGDIERGGGAGTFLSARDRDDERGRGEDTFRIKIWDRSTGEIVYDNQMGTRDETDASDTIERGNVIMHHHPW